MSEKTSIAWCRSTFNPFIGCTKVGPGCDHCYAEALDKRHKWGGAVHWGPGVPRYRTHVDPTILRWVDGITWDDLQRLKREAGYGDREAVEVYPPAACVVNEANIRHLWILPSRMPFSWGT